MLLLYLSKSINVSSVPIKRLYNIEYKKKKQLKFVNNPMKTNRTRVTRKSCSCFALILNVSRDVIKIRASEVGKNFPVLTHFGFCYLCLPSTPHL